MEAKKVLDVVMREMCAFGQGWRADWSDFDGRALRRQLEHLAGWAEDALTGKDSDYTQGSQFLDEKDPDYTQGGKEGES